jgi:nucleoside-diphosphate-sugar epimerase
MKTLVTGATGRFAPHLIRDLIGHGHEVVLFCRKQPADEFKDLEWFKGDINKFEDCYKAVNKKGFDAIHNAAAKPYPTDMPGRPEWDDFSAFPLTMQTNIMGLYNLLQAAIRSDIGIFVHTGSNCALGHGYRISGRPFEIKYLPIDEDHPSDAEDSYSFSKLVGEQLMESYYKVYGIRCYSLRSAGITNSQRRIAMKEKLAPTGGWSEWMFPWIASEDLALAHRLLMEKAGSIVGFGAYYCNNDDTMLMEPTMEIVEKFRPDLLPLIKEPLEGHATLFSNKRLKAVVDWEPRQNWR